MGPPRRYFDHAATSFPKPPGVAEAVRNYIDRIGASPGRGSYHESLDAGRLLEQCRIALRTLFHARAGDAVIFTLNGTDAMNLAIKGLLRPGDHAVTTVMDHNSALRPLSALERRCGVAWTAVAAEPRSTHVSPAAVESAIRPETRLVVVSHASNVTGALQPIEEIAAGCRRRGVPLLVDAAQSAGHVPIDFAGAGLDLLAAPGHKGLLGPLGTGVLLIREELVERVATLREGGTGSQSELPVQPDFAPDKFEPGSHNGPGIAGLLAAVQWVASRSVAGLRAHEADLMQRMIAGLDRIEGLEWFGPRQIERRVGVFSVRIDGIEPGELSMVLEQQFGVLTRSGLHCAPLAHQAIGTHQRGGATRFSLGAFHTPGDIDAACEALREVAAAAVGS